MKQYTTPEQTAKLIELGFKKPKSISGYYHRGPYEYDAEANTKMVVYDDTQYPIYAYSIGELLEILPPYINNEDDFFGLAIYRGTKWTVAYGGIFDIKIGVTQTELIDALYDIIVKLKEEKLI